MVGGSTIKGKQVDQGYSNLGNPASKPSYLKWKLAWSLDKWQIE
jgi:hypothetical protein